jgi:hypothetical protein
MRRTTITLAAALVLLAVAPAIALARHHDRRHHSRAHHARIERFGRDVKTATKSSAENAGTVRSFSGGKLTFMLSDGSTVSGMVTQDTELECMAPEQSQTVGDDGDTTSGDQTDMGDNQSSDDQSSGEDQAEDQNENQAEDQNENQAEDQNENQAEDQNENEAADETEAEDDCSTANLTQDTVVRGAVLRISSAGDVWKKVELGS